MGQTNGKKMKSLSQSEAEIPTPLDLFSGNTFEIWIYTKIFDIHQKIFSNYLEYLYKRSIRSFPYTAPYFS